IHKNFSSIDSLLDPTILSAKFACSTLSCTISALSVVIIFFPSAIFLLVASLYLIHLYVSHEFLQKVRCSGEFSPKNSASSLSSFRTNCLNSSRIFLFSSSGFIKKFLHLLNLSISCLVVFFSFLRVCLLFCCC